MKREFYKRLYFFELKTRRALDVFRLSLPRVKSYSLFNAVVASLAPEDLADFCALVEGTTYELARTCIADLLYRIPFTRQAYDAFRRLDVGPLSPGRPPLLGVYNYCYYKQSTGDCSVDVAAPGHGEAHECGDAKRRCVEAPASEGTCADPMVHPQEPCSSKGTVSATQCSPSGFAFTGLAADELREMRETLREVCVRNRGDAVLRAYVRVHLKDELLLAILDENGRVNGALHPAAGLLLLRPNQIYGLSGAGLLEVELCRIWGAGGACARCGRHVLAGCDAAAPAAGTPPAGASECLETALLEEDLETACNLLLHCGGLGTARVLRIVLRLYAARRGRRATEERGYNACPAGPAQTPDDRAAAAVDSLSFGPEAEETAISFLKSRSCPFGRVLTLVPALMKSRHLYFACFATMADEALGGTSPYRMMRIRALVHRYAEVFGGIADMTIAYYYDRRARGAGGAPSLEGAGEVLSLDAVDSDTDACRAVAGGHRAFCPGEDGPACGGAGAREPPAAASPAADYEYLHAAFAGLAEMHSMDAPEFVQRYFFNIFVAVQPGRRHLTEAFLARNRRYILVRKIMEGAAPFECNDVDVMVGLMFNGNFSHARYFRPSPRDFMQKNLSQLLFRIKSAHKSGEYSYVHGPREAYGCGSTGWGHAVYRILRYVLSSVQIPLYFNYIWPTIEYFLNREECECGLDFVEWLRGEHYSPLMVPYMRMPFVEIGDLPVIPGIEDKLCRVLGRFFRGETGRVPGPQGRAEDGGADERFVESFLHHYCSNAVFRNKILDLYPDCPARTKALLGCLRRDHRRAVSMRAPESMPRAVLEHFLLRIDHNRQELYSFVIQEFLKNIREPLSPEAESIAGQFRHTRYELQDEKARRSCERADDGVCVDGSYADFLRSLLRSLCARLEGRSYLRYLVLLDADVLEYSCLCLVKACRDEDPGFALDGLVRAVNGHYRDFAGTDYEEMLRFMLKINTFVGTPLCSRRDCLNYALALRDYYCVVQLLDGEAASECEGALLQLAYYMVGDSVRVKELNKQNLIYSAIALFFEFATEWNFKAARQCYDGYLRQHGCAAAGPVLGTEPGPGAVAGVMREVLDMHDAEEGAIDEDGTECGMALLESCAYGGVAAEPAGAGQGGAQHACAHGVGPARRRRGPVGGARDRNCMLHISMDCRLIRQSGDLERTLGIITRRRSVAENRECIMRMHRALAGCLGVPGFLRTVELEFIRSLRRRRDYANCMRCIARLVLRQEWEALYELALMKLDQKCDSEARELLARVLSLCAPGDEAYHKAALKLCELSRDAEMHAHYVRVAEEGLPDMRQSARNLAYLQRLYFLSAQLLEKSDVLQALRYYQRSFDSNYGAVPRFFHLAARLSPSLIPHVESMVAETIKHNIAVLLPYYSQISNRLSIQTDSFRLYNMATRAMLEAAPQETFWDTLILVNSRREDIGMRVQTLVDGLSLEKRVLFRDTQRVAEQFMQISRSKSKALTVGEFELRGLLPSDVSVPGRRARIHGVRDEVVVFVSLQRPKKIVLIGDDGVEYPMIVKSKDDLRKDSRMMELGILLNKLFDDGYYIRNYRVIPFSHDAGIIEYVPGLVSLKTICAQSYTHINEVATSFTKHMRVGGNNMERVLKMFPPVFHGWMKRQYADPYAFYMRRENYIRTYAIMCVVGWFIGLGDRHAENTHFDPATGDTVHVDLNCIFDKGQTFEIPERVPFRLTQNIVDGFGCLGLEGPFRRTMHYTLRVLRENKDVILSNLLSFLFDPLFEWARKRNEPERILGILGDRLGFENEEELAERMIQEATSLNNLGSMYIGWMPFL